jgi:regulator of protease activity HflC (stomatin/prohibitin superfamily)
MTKEDKKFAKPFIISGFLILIVMFLISIITRISPGQVGVVVNLLGDNKGVESQTLGVGVNFTAPWKTVYVFPTYDQNHVWNDIKFQTQEGLQVSSNIGVTFSLEGDKIPILFAKYRKGIEEITNIFIKNNVRDAINLVASKMRVEDLYGEKKEEFFSNVKKILSEELMPIGFVIHKVYIIGNFDVPSLVTDALNRKIEAIQRAEQRENELREAEAEAKKQIAKAKGEAQSKIVAATAEAEANEKLSKSITKKLIQLKFLEKWNGVLPKVTSDKDFILDLKSIEE